jgi:hypothetical protein
MKKAVCRHDHKKAIQVGNVDYMCPWCKELIDPIEWFFMNSFTFVDETPVKKRIGKKVITGRKVKTPKRLGK